MKTTKLIASCYTQVNRHLAVASNLLRALPVIIGGLEYSADMGGRMSEWVAHDGPVVTYGTLARFFRAELRHTKLIQNLVVREACMVAVLQQALMYESMPAHEAYSRFVHIRSMLRGHTPVSIEAAQQGMLH